MTMAPDNLDNRLVLNTEYGERSFPFEEWRWLRANEPVHMTDAHNVQPFWAITKHRHITEISAQPDVFSSAAGNIILFRKDQMDAVADESNPFNQMRVIISMDPPDHRTFRKVASGFFTPRGITRLDEIVTDTATLMMDRLAEHGDEPVDFVELVAQRHPLRVLCTILGVPEEDEDRLLEREAAFAVLGVEDESVVEIVGRHRHGPMVGLGPSPDEMRPRRRTPARRADR